MTKVCVITGASSGIGFAIAEKFLNEGYIVYSFSRTAPKNDKIKHIVCDVTNRENIEKAFLQVAIDEGRLDCFVNNAGMGISGPAEYEPASDIQKIIDINLTGAINCACVATPYLRQTKGTMINVGSVGGIFPLPFQSLYSATKSGLQSFSVALKNELRPLGVKVVCLLPCDTKTGFTDNRVKADITNNTVYGDRVNKRVGQMEHDERNGMSPQKVANTVFKLANRKNPPATCTMGGLYKFFRFLVRILPERFVYYILYLMYGK